MTYSQLLYEFQKQLIPFYESEEINNFFYWSLEHVENLNRLQFSIKKKQEIDKEYTLKYHEIIAGLRQEKPIQYLLGEAEFYGLTFKVTESVLIPRPETEELIRLIEDNYKNSKEALRILDIGTGSGCIPIALDSILNNAKVVSIDISAEAIKIAEINNKLNKTAVIFHQRDVLNENISDLGVFNIIVSNPPYVTNSEKKLMQNNVLNNEPHLALFVEDSNPLIFYKRIGELAFDNLAADGQLYFEINEKFGLETQELLKQIGFSHVFVIKDLSKKDRMIKATK